MNFLALQVAAYVITVPAETWEFPILPWGKRLFKSHKVFFFILLGAFNLT